MKFNLVVDIDDSYVNEYLADNKGMTVEYFCGQINNACYLGLDCTNAIIMRLFNFGVCETYVKKTVVCDKSWGEFWGDNFPTETECPIDVIEHHAEGHAFPITDDIIVFARAMWNEGNLTEKLS